MADIVFYPYGNAHESGSSGHYTFSCQHGTVECEWNQIETCALNIIPDKLKQFNFIECIEENDSSRSGTIDYNGIISKCTSQSGTTNYASQITTCRTSSQGNAWEHAVAQATASLNPPHTYVPYITTKNGHSDSDQSAIQSSLLSYVCKNYTGSNKSSACPRSSEEPVLATFPRCERDATFLQ